MQITPEQMQRFDSLAMAGFEQRLLQHLQQHFAAQMQRADEATTRQLVQHLIARAHHWGLHSEDQVTAYAELALQVHPRFDEHPDHGWAHEVLADEFIISPDLRLATLQQAAASRLAPGAATVGTP